MAQFEAEIRDRLGNIEGKLNLLVPAIQDIRKGLYGEVGIDPRLRKVEEVQATQKGFVARAALMGSFVGGIVTLTVTLIAQFFWRKGGG